MKLLPPKPPKPEGTEKTTKKKIEEDDAVGSTLSEVPEALEVPEISDMPEPSEFLDEKKGGDTIAKDNSNSFVRIDEVDKKNSSLNNFLPNDLPPAVPDNDLPLDDLLPPEAIENQSLDQKVAVADKNTANSGEKKKGFFSKLFVKKEKVPKKEEDKKEIKPTSIDLNKEESQDEIQKFEDADNNLDELSKALEKSIGDTESIDKLTAVDENFVPAPVQEKQSLDSKYSKYIPGKSWDDEIKELPKELPDVSVLVVQDDKKYKKDNFVDYIKESSKGSKKEKTKEVKKEDKKQEIQEINLGEDWGAESEEAPKKEEKSSESEKTKETVSTKKEKDGKKDKLSKNESKSEEVKEKKAEKIKMAEITSGKDELEEELPKEAVNDDASKKSSKPGDIEGMALSSEINDWKSKSILIATTKDKPDRKTMQQINVKLRKVLKLYENKLLKIAADKRKSILFDIKRINRKEAELERKEKATQSKESMLLSLEKSLSERKNELDVLVLQEAKLTARKESLQNEIAELRKKSNEDLAAQEAASATRKESLQNEIAELRKKSNDIKAEIISNQKLFDSQKRTIIQETKNLQDSFNGLKAHFENEKRRGDKRLAELAKGVDEAQLQMDEMMKKSRKVAVQLKAKEDALHLKEKEVLDLISQEKKILSLLKGNEENGLTAEDIKSRRRARERKPATVIGFGGEPEIYVDDEDTLNQKIRECKELIREANYDDAKIIYNQIRDEFISAVLDDASRKTIRHEIRELYDDIALKMISRK